MLHTPLARRARLAAVSIVAVAALGLTACSGSGPIASDANVNSVTASLSASIDEAIANAMQLSGSDAAVVGVWTASGDYARGYGDGVDANSAIRAAQAAQPELCALLLDLVEDGTVKLGREVEKDLPRQVGISGITYGQLCTATSGLADFKSRIRDIFANNPTRAWTDRELFAHGLAHSPLAEPGAETHLSDTNSLLLARALQRVTDTNIDVLLEEHVFGPAGMASSYFPKNLQTDLTLPSGGMNGLTYPSSGGAPVCEVEPVRVNEVAPAMLSQAGGTVTTVADLKRFYEKYLSGGFGGEGSAATVTTVVPTALPDENASADEIAPSVGPADQQWGFGLENVGPLFGMSGAITGTLTAAYHDPASGFSVVVSLNNSSAGAEFVRALAFQLAAISGANVGWSAEDQLATLTSKAVCQAAPEDG